MPAADATLKPCRARRRGDGATKRGRCCHCFVLSLATLAALAGAGLFIAGAILQVQSPGLALQCSGLWAGTPAHVCALRRA